MKPECIILKFEKNIKFEFARKFQIDSIKNLNFIYFEHILLIVAVDDSVKSERGMFPRRAFRVNDGGFVLFRGEFQFVPPGASVDCRIRNTEIEALKSGSQFRSAKNVF